MYRLLIADSDEPFSSAAKTALSGDFEVLTCQDGDTALELLLRFEPQVLILNLSLPYKDGLTVLQQAAYLPPVILVIASYVNPYTEQTCADCGVGYILISPKINALRVRVIDMFNRWKNNRTPPDLHAQIVLHLHILNIQTHRAGYAQLCEAILQYYQDRDQCLKTVLYPKVASLCHATSGGSVERAIRDLLVKAWKHRDPVAWAKYFSNYNRCPSNKVFFDTLSNMLEE